jgi:hypothetical protein
MSLCKAVANVSVGKNSRGRLPCNPISAYQKNLSVYLSIYLSMTLQLFCWAFVSFSVSWPFTQSVGLHGRGISPSQGRYLHTGHRKHRINANIHASSGNRTHDASVWAGDDISYLRPRGHCDRHVETIYRPFRIFFTQHDAWLYKQSATLRSPKMPRDTLTGNAN